LDRDVREAKIVYPNLFDVSVDSKDTDEVIISKISAALSLANSALKPGKTFPDKHPWKFLTSSSLEAPALSQILLQNTDIKAALFDALRWKNLDIEAKYSHAFDLALSHKTTDTKLLIPEKKSLYEIAYLGGQGDARNFVFGFAPEDESELPDWFKNIQSVQSGYTSLGQINDSDVNSEFSLSANEIAALLGGVSDQGGTEG
jgi:hypothetical protein